MSAAVRVLHVAAEVHPLIKTGGLADVVGALPNALRSAGCDVRLLMPGYGEVLARLAGTGALHSVGAPLGWAFGAARVRLLRTTLPGSALPLYLIDAPWLYERAGNAYVNAQGLPWDDNHLRFGLLGHVAAQLAAGGLDPDWRAELVHAHDWHAGLAPVYLRQHPANAVRTVFTIHNLAFQGRFPLAIAPDLGLRAAQLTPAALEFHGDLSFMKGALLNADAITTISPSYAREMLKPECGEGLDGVLRERAATLVGVLNGVDTTVWDSARDGALAMSYDTTNVQVAKRANRRALRAECGLADDEQRPLVAVVGRLSAQKGLDLLLEAIADPSSSDLQLFVLGTGEASRERLSVSPHAWLLTKRLPIGCSAVPTRSWCRVASSPVVSPSSMACVTAPCRSCVASAALPTRSPMKRRARRAPALCSKRPLAMPCVTRCCGQ